MTDIEVTAQHEGIARHIKKTHNVNVKPESVALVLSTAKDYRRIAREEAAQRADEKKRQRIAALKAELAKLEGSVPFDAVEEEPKHGSSVVDLAKARKAKAAVKVEEPVAPVEIEAEDEFVEPEPIDITLEAIEVESDEEDWDEEEELDEF